MFGGYKSQETLEMLETEIENKEKNVGNTMSQCRTCLSIGRKLSPLGEGEHASIFWKITGFMENDTLRRNNILLCWECRGLLRKMAVFHQRVKKANNLLQMSTRNVYETLSSLKSVIMDDLHHNTIFMYEQTDIDMDQVKSELLNDLDEEQFLLDDVVENIDQDYLFERQNYKHECSTTETEQIQNNGKQKKISVWAQKRRLENSKPKYKRITNDKRKFRRVQIDFSELERLKREREGNTEYKCEKCFLGFERKRQFLKHNRRCHGCNGIKISPVYICDVCAYTFNNKRHLSAHLRKHRFRYDCAICSYSCLDDKSILNHIRRLHKQVLMCLQCGHKFGCSRDFYRHYREYHERFICDFCGVSFKMRYCIEAHIKKQHTPFECRECNKQFARYNGLWLHNKTRHTRSAGTAYCVECDKEFVDIYRYRWHLANSVKHKRRPAKKNRYPCQACAKVFTKKIYMKEHYNFVHLKQYKYHCDACEKNFVRKPDLVKHRRRVHEGILPPKNKICYMCGRAFTTNKILCNHIRTHTGERPFACARCPAAFAQRAALAAHNRALHTDTDSAVTVTR